MASWEILWSTSHARRVWGRGVTVMAACLQPYIVQMEKLSPKEPLPWDRSRRGPPSGPADRSASLQGVIVSAGSQEGNGGQRLCIFLGLLTQVAKWPPESISGPTPLGGCEAAMRREVSPPPSPRKLSYICGLGRSSLDSPLPPPIPPLPTEGRAHLHDAHLHDAKAFLLWTQQHAGQPCPPGSSRGATDVQALEAHVGSVRGTARALSSAWGPGGFPGEVMPAHQAE